MAAPRRDDRDRRGDDRDNYPRKVPRDTRDVYPQEPSREPTRPRRELQEWFLDGDGISRQVLQEDICKYLGPEATSKPYVHNVR